MTTNSPIIIKQQKKSNFLIFSAICIVIGAFFSHDAKALYYEFIWDTTKSPVVGPSTQLSLIANNVNAIKFVGATNGRLYISTNGGDDWTETQPAGNVDKNWSSISASEDGSVLFAAVYGGRLYVSLDSGDSWAETQPAGNVNKNWQNVVAGSNGQAIATVFGGRLYSSTDYGENWVEAGDPLDVNLNWSTLSLDNGETALAGVEGGRLYISSDGGSHWSEIQPAGNVDRNWQAVGCDGGIACLAAAFGGRIYLSTSEGYDWTEIQPLGDSNQAWSEIGIFGPEGSLLFAATNPGRLYFSVDLGETWFETQPEGDANKNWSAVVAESDTTVWTANGTNVIFNDEMSLVTPVAPTSFTDSSNTTNMTTFSGLPVFEITSAQNSGTSIFSLAHGNVQIGDKFYMGTRTNPSKLIVFNNPNDLTDYNSVTLPGIVGVEAMTYDSIHHRIYASVTSSFTSENLKIYSINPDNINDFTQVANLASLQDRGSPGIVTDGTFLYGVTYANPPEIFKIRISDWTLVTKRTWTGGHTSGHAAVLHTYNDRTELYISASLGTSALAKVNVSDLSYQEYNFGTQLSFSDDISFQYIDETGGILYVGSEDQNQTYALDTRTMTVTSFLAPRTYGNFVNDGNLYVTGHRGYIGKYIDFDPDSPRIYQVPGEIPNELFFSSSGKKFFTNWSIPGYLKEFTETSNIAATSTVTLTWSEVTPSIVHNLYISTDGIDYTQVLGANSPRTFNDLLPGTQYWFKIIAVNGGLTSAPVIHTITTPTFVPAALSAIPTLVSQSVTQTSISLNWSGNGAEYLIKQGSTSSGWVSATSFTFSNLVCDHEYTVKLKARNSDGVESDYRTTYVSTSPCPGGGGILSVPPQAANGEDVDFIINNGEGVTSNRELLISMNADPEVVKSFSISLDKDFTGSSLFPYISKTTFTLPDVTNTYTVYVRYYSVTGTVSKVMSKQIHYNSSKKVSIPDDVKKNINSTTEKYAKQDFFKRNLMFGMRGTDVKSLQNFLNNNGFPLAQSGVGSSNYETKFFGRLTRSAVATFQKAKQITPTFGNFGPITRAYINKLISQK